MGDLRPRENVMLILAMFSRHARALAWARDKAEHQYGSIALASELLPFDQTNYYEADMGTPLQKQFLAFERLIELDDLPDIKLQTNAWEVELAATGEYEERRPLNLDPGYLCLGKLVLATTKDHAHRIYLRDGIFAEVTLHYDRTAGWQPNGWTFADYRVPKLWGFLDRCRKHYRSLGR
ncbi:MAG: DUF4416 family protein [Pirellulales bacterium]|nr:DUF4416 family protein [Pirellulales bacterium]